MDLSHYTFRNIDLEIYDLAFDQRSFILCDNDEELYELFFGTQFLSELMWCLDIGEFLYRLEDIIILDSVVDTSIIVVDITEDRHIAFGVE